MLHLCDIGTSKSGAKRKILTWQCASCHSGVQFFAHLNFQKWPGAGVFCAFWLENALLATAACHFWTSELPKVFRRRGVLYIFTWNVLRATAACHFSCLLWAATSAPAALASLLFDPADTQILGKNTAFRDFPNISRRCIFFLLTFAQL